MRELPSLKTYDLIDLFKADKPDEVIDYLIKNGIDPSYDNNIISDYAALHLRDELLVDFLKEIEKIGGDPLGHDSILKNAISGDKIRAVTYLLNHKRFNKDMDNLIYIINTACMYDKVESLKLLDEKLNLFDYKMSTELNPTFINVTTNWCSLSCFNFIFDKYSKDNFQYFIHKEVFKSSIDINLKEDEGKKKVFVENYITKITDALQIDKFDSSVFEDSNLIRDKMAELYCVFLDKKLNDVNKRQRKNKI